MAGTLSALEARRDPASGLQNGRSARRRARAAAGALLAACALAGLARGQEREPQPILDRTVELELAPDPGEGRALRTVPVPIDFDGTLVAWAESTSALPLLRILRGEEQLAVSAPATPAAIPWVELVVESGDALTLELSVEGTTWPCPVKLTLSASRETPETLEAAREAETRLAELGAMRGRKQRSEALALALSAIEAIVATPGVAESRRLNDLLFELGRSAFKLGDIPAAREAWERVLRHAEDKLPPGHLLRLRARNNTGVAVREMGEIWRGHEILVEVCAFAQTSLPPGDPFRIDFMENLARASLEIGQVEEGIALIETTLAECKQAFGPDDPRTKKQRFALQTVRNLGASSGQALEARRQMLEQALETLPEGTKERLSARLQLVDTLCQLGDVRPALELATQLVTELEADPQSEDFDLLYARTDLGIALWLAGEPRAAREQLELAVAGLEQLLPDSHTSVQVARSTLASVMKSLGEIDAALELLVKSHAALEQVLPPGHRRLVEVRMNLANTLAENGDLESARRLQERVLGELEQRLPDDDLVLQRVRLNLALTLSELGDSALAEPLMERAIEVMAAGREPGDLELENARLDQAALLDALGRDEESLALLRDVQHAIEVGGLGDHHIAVRARSNLATLLLSMGRVDEAVEEMRGAIEDLTKTYGADHPATVLQRANLVAGLAASGELEQAAELALDVLAQRRETLAPESHDLQISLALAALTQAWSGNGARAAELAEELARVAGDTLRGVALSSPAREAEARSRRLDKLLAQVFAAACAVEEPALRARIARAAFELGETMRGAGLAASRSLHGLGNDPALERLQDERTRASREVARLSRAAETGEQDGVEAEPLALALRAKERVETRILERVRELSGGGGLIARPTVEAIAAQLEHGTAACALRELHEPELGVASDVAAGLWAFVVRADGTLETVRLGDAAVVEDAALEWRELALGKPAAGRGVGLPAGEPTESSEGALERAGRQLTELVLEPVLSAAGKVERLILVLDGGLHSVPWDALPRGDGLVADGLELRIRATLWELLDSSPPPTGTERLLLVGGLDYDARDPGEGPSDSAASVGEREFRPLAATLEEVQALRALYERRRPGTTAVQVLTGSAATRDALREQARGATFVHLATHGAFRPARAPTTVALSPLTSCGLALSGANAVDRASGARPGLLSGEELATLDLGNCRLAVLSACETALGIEIAGQGTASLQKALHMAGARAAITSLWKVDDASTREFMVAFYERLWSGETSIAAALRDAKRLMRERGRPLSSWAGWIVTGDAD